MECTEAGALGQRAGISKWLRGFLACLALPSGILRSVEGDRILCVCTCVGILWSADDFVIALCLRGGRCLGLTDPTVRTPRLNLIEFLDFFLTASLRDNLHTIKVTCLKYNS